MAGANPRVSIRCPACGCASAPGRFDSEHTVELVIHRYGGRGRIAVDKQSIDVETAVWLEARLARALADLREGIAIATGASVE